MPMRRAGTDTQQNAVQLKNVLRDAEKQLEGLRSRAGAVAALLNPARALLDDSFFWERQADGLAIMLAPNFARHYRLPITLEPQAVVGSRFHVTPLLPLLTSNGHYYVLALSQGKTRMLECSRYSCRELEADALPQFETAVLQFEDIDGGHLNFHVGPPGGGQSAAVFHGHGDVGTEDNKELILRYFQLLHDKVGQILKQEQAPIVLAGVEYLFPLYRQAGADPRVLAQGIPGSAQLKTPEQLQAESWAIVEPFFRREREEVASQYEREVARDLASNDIREVAPAALQGRVRALLLARNLHQWGTIDEATGQVQLVAGREPGSEDLLGFAAVQTILRQGKVYAIEPSEVPGGTGVAAVFRFGAESAQPRTE
jgi:hypothetical protein